MEYVLGIDIGTGSVKAVAIDVKGNSFEDNQQHYPFNSPKPGYHEQNPEQIWNAFTQSIKGIINQTGSQPLAISLSSAMHSFIAVDDNGNALAPMMTWADNRSAEIAVELKATGRGMSIYEATGTPIHSMSPLCKLIWLRENDPKLFHNAYKFISIKEFIWYKLFNEFAIDYSIASSTGLFNITKFEWHADALKLAGITTDGLSAPVPTDYTKTGSSLEFLSKKISFVVGASDGCLANLGSMATTPGVAAMTIGTSGAVRVASNKPLPNTKAMTFSYILDKNTYICGGPINNGGVVMQWWVKNVAGPNPTEKDYEQIFSQIAKVSIGTGGLIFLPYLTGERAPIWDSESCGNFFGVRLQHTQADFSRAVLEGICFAMRDVLDAVQKNSESITQINISGGFTKSKIWVQILADITDKKLAILQADDASAIGAAFIALKVIGAISDYPKVSDDLIVYQPNGENREIYNKNFSVYRQLYTDLKATMHRVYKESI